LEGEWFIPRESGSITFLASIYDVF